MLTFFKNIMLILKKNSINLILLPNKRYIQIKLTIFTHTLNF